MVSGNKERDGLAEMQTAAGSFIRKRVFIIGKYCTVW